MSFIERNKAWVLPLLGVAAAGVIYMNVKMLGPSAKVVAPPAAPPVAGTPGPAPQAVAPPPPAPLPQPTPARPGTPDLWSDLRALEEPWAGLNQTEAILARGGPTLTSDILHPPTKILSTPTNLHVTEPKAILVSGPSTGPSTPVAPPPEVDFLIRNVMGSSAWMDGSGFKVGQLLPGGWRVRHITPDMVEVEGPAGIIRRWTNPLKARTSPHAPSSEAP